MKKTLSIVLTIAVIVLFQACNSKNKSKEIEQYRYTGTKVQLNNKLKKKVGSWIEEGAECYGIVMVNSPEGSIQAVKEVKAKVLIIQNDRIKMKALENIDLAPRPGCTKMKVSKGDIWWEKEGDLFQTKKGAIQFINTVKQKKIHMQKQDSP